MFKYSMTQSLFNLLSWCLTCSIKAAENRAQQLVFIGSNQQGTGEREAIVTSKINRYVYWQCSICKHTPTNIHCVLPLALVDLRRAATLFTPHQRPVASDDPSHTTALGPQDGAAQSEAGLLAPKRLRSLFQAHSCLQSDRWCKKGYYLCNLGSFWRRCSEAGG